MILFDDITRILAVVGGVTGPLGLLVSYLTYRRDRGSIRVRLLRGYRVTQGSADDAARRLLAFHREQGTDPPMALFVRDPDKEWASIEVTNVGRRKMIIEKIGWIPRSRSNFIIPGGFLGDPDWLPAELDEGYSRNFPIEEAKLNGALAVFAFDSIGRGHYGSFERSWHGTVLRFKTLLRRQPYI